MATLAELQTLAHNNDLRGKIERAITIKALVITKEATPSIDRLEWAEDALSTPETQIVLMLNYVLAENANATVVQIIGATDTSIQTNVDTAIDALHP